jgi:hypothetical protein
MGGDKSSEVFSSRIISTLGPVPSAIVHGRTGMEMFQKSKYNFFIFCDVFLEAEVLACPCDRIEKFHVSEGVVYCLGCEQSN